MPDIPTRPWFYEVIVGNIGTVHDGCDAYKAASIYNRYVDLSKGGHGRAAGETVTLQRDGEIVQEHWEEERESLEEMREREREIGS